MRLLHVASLSGCLAVGTISLPLSASTPSVVAASQRTTAPIGRQLAELKGSDTVAGDAFGWSVAISGTTAVVGAVNPDKLAGRAYVFTMTKGDWKQTAELTGSDTVAGDAFGSSVAISGATAVVGAPSHAKLAGRAYVFTKTTTGWKQVTEMNAAGGGFGSSVAISGSTAVVGAPSQANFAGRAYVFTKTAAGWKQVAVLKGSDTVARDYFGSSVALSGSTALVGAIWHANRAGRAYVFTKTTTGWKQVAELKGSTALDHSQLAFGESPFGFGGPEFGFSLAISGLTALVGEPGYAGFGQAYVFTRTASGWKQVGILRASDTEAFGFSVAIRGTTAVVGAPWDANSAGRAYVFTKVAGGWRQAAVLKGSDTLAGDYFGGSASLSDRTLVVGAHGHAKGAGRVYVIEA